MIPILLRVLVASTLACALFGCGFALRSETSLQGFSGLYVSDAVARDQRLVFARYAKENQLDWLDEAVENSIAITDIDERYSLRSTRVDSLGRVVEYWLNIEWRVDVQLKEPVRIVLIETATLGLSEDSLIGFEKEKARLERELRSQLAQSLVTRVGLMDESHN